MFRHPLSARRGSGSLGSRYGSAPSGWVEVHSHFGIECVRQIAFDDHAAEASFAPDLYFGAEMLAA
jgi:hypothetical protein